MKTLVSKFEEICEQYANKIALLFLGTPFTYSELKELIEKFAAGLRELGANKEDKILIYLWDCPQWVISFLAIQKIGAVPIPINPDCSLYELEHFIRNSEAKMIICHDVNVGYVKQASAQSKLKKIIVTNIADLLPWWKKWFGRAFDRIPRGEVSRDPEIRFFLKLIRKSSFKLIKSEGENALGAIFYTSGVGDLPRGVPYSHDHLLDNLNRAGEIWGELLKQREHKLLLLMPLFHVLGAIMLFGLGFQAGNTVILMPRINIDAILEAIQREKVCLLGGFPKIYKMILEHERLEMYKLSSLEYCICGGDFLPSQIIGKWKSKFGLPIYQIYATTEVGLISASSLNKELPLGSVGYVLSGRRIRLVKPGTLELISSGEVGELLVGSDHMPSGYWNSPEESARSFIEMEGDKWLRTGDLFEVDKGGLLWFKGRVEDIIEVENQRVMALEIEAVLRDHPSVLDACVVGVGDGERVKAFVVLRGGVRGITAQDLIRWCQERLPSHKIPNYIEFRDLLPRSSTGKLLRRRLREEERRRAGSSL